MTIPTTITIGTITYRISTDTDEWIRKENSEQRHDVIGRTDNSEAAIYIDPKASPDVQRQTLWHETLHALAYAVMGSPDWRRLGPDQDTREEAVVRAWEHPTLAVLRDNPQLVKYLTGGPA